MAKGYVLKAESKSGVVYYMTFVLSTSDISHAYPFKTKKEAELNKDRFKYLFYNEEPKITIERIGD